MEWLDIDTSNLGTPKYASPTYLSSTALHYVSGIEDLDKVLEERKLTLSDMNASFGIYIYKDLLLFVIYQGKKALGRNTIKRNSVIGIKAYHGQSLKIKDSYSINPIGFGLLMGIANFLEIATRKKIKKGEPVLGSTFEISFNSQKNGEQEKIILACADRNKTNVEKFLNKIIEHKS